MPARDETALQEYVRTSVRRVAWMREILRSLGINVAAGDLGKKGQAGLAACRTELLRIAATHPVFLSLALDAWELAGADDDEEEGGEDEADGVHPQASLLPAPDENALYDQFPTIEDLADLRWLPVSGEYAAAGGDAEPIAQGELGIQLAKALEQIAALQISQADLESSLERRARAQAVQLFKDSNAGVAEVTLVGGRQSRRERHAATAFELHPEFAVGPWDRTVRYENEFEEPATARDFEAVLFNCNMRADDHARLQKQAGVVPDIWRNPPKFSAKDVSLLDAAGQKRDEDWTSEQETLLRPLKPVVRALDFVARALEHVDNSEHDDSLDDFESREISAASAAELLDALRQARSTLSDCVHSTAFQVTKIQKLRDTSLQTAVAGGEYELEDELDGADWVRDTSDLHSRAQTVRSVRKDLGKLGGKRHPNGQPRPGGGGARDGGKPKLSQWQQNKNRDNTRKQREATAAARRPKGGDKPPVRKKSEPAKAGKGP